MGLWKDIKLGLLKCSDVLQPGKTYAQFPHQLRDFDLPQARQLPDPLPEIAILTPCRNAVDHLPTYFDLVDALEYPKDLVHLFMLEGDSTDQTELLAKDMLKARCNDYASANFLKFNSGFEPGDLRRSTPDIQRQRRATIAMCRNRLLRAATKTNTAYFLFVDVDLAEIPSETLRGCLAFQAPILMANCLLQNTAAVFDLNAFRYTRPVSDRMANRYVKGGLYQPPKGYFREYCDRSQGNQIEPLHSVGGTFLLIRRDVIEAGVDFPEEPFHLHIETEGFALKASEAGFGSFVAPQLVVYHPWET